MCSFVLCHSCHSCPTYLLIKSFLVLSLFSPTHPQWPKPWPGAEAAINVGEGAQQTQKEHGSKKIRSTHVIGSLTKKHAQLFRRSFNSIFTCNLSSFLLTLLFSLPSPPHPLTSTPPPSTFPPNLPSFPGSPEFHESLPQHGQVQRTPEDHVTAPHPLLPDHQEGPDIPI